jgi:hypothetical protein
MPSCRVLASNSLLLVLEIPMAESPSPIENSAYALQSLTGKLRCATRRRVPTAVFDKPFVKKSALIGTDDLPASFYNEIKRFSRRADFQNPRGTFGLVGGRFGGGLSRLRDSKQRA